MAGIYWNETEGIISLSSDGENWITIADKNLGATTVYNDGDTLSEANCGKRYQRGNNYGFPFTGITSYINYQVNASNYGPGNYYSSDKFAISNYNWASPSNYNLWGYTTGTLEAMRGPCTSGWHIPTDDEFTSIKTIGVSIGAWTDTGGNNFKKYLKIPFAGYRNSYSGDYQSGVGEYGYYWTSREVSDTQSRVLYFGSTWLNAPYAFFIQNGMPIRPFKNEAVVPDYTWTKLYGDDIPEPPKTKLKRIVKGANYYFFGDNRPTHASGLTLNKSNIMLTTAGQTAQPVAIVLPENAVNKSVLWSSSDTTVATVSRTGLVTCVTPGSCTMINV